MAGLLGEATEELAHHTGERVGRLLSATRGNAAGLIITVALVSSYGQSADSGKGAGRGLIIGPRGRTPARP